MSPINNICLYGISPQRCNTVKKAKIWLDDHHITYKLHDYKKQGIERQHLQRWCAEHGWERIINRRGTTFRQLPETEKNNLDEEAAIALMLRSPSMIKRPILEFQSKSLVGFDEEEYQVVFAREQNCLK